MEAQPPESTAPVSNRMPPGIPFIIGNEAAERFCFYGMRTILTVYMTKYLLDRSGALAVMTPENAKASFHFFVSAVYFLPFFGAILADGLWGKYKTILLISLVYCLGCFVLVLDGTRTCLWIGLALIAIGSGGIKPCVSASVGDQFGPSNNHLLSKAFGWFYFSINFGSFFSTMLTPWLLDKYGPRVAFGVPGVFMLLATLIFWFGRNRFIRVPPAGRDFIRETFSPSSLKIIAGVIPIFVAEAIFWSLWDQTGSAWVLQAEKMDLKTWGFEWLPSQVQAVNPVLILLLIPVCTYALYPAISKVFPMTQLRRVGLGLFLAVISFLISAWIESRIQLGEKPTVWWQFLGFVVISFAEIMVSITCLEFAYTQAPKRLKSLIMSLNLMSISLGNAITSATNVLIQNKDGTSKLPGASYYLFFAGLMLVTAIVFIPIARRYRDRGDVQDQAA
jgi:POT family proton-dependent oligopeptide transporter